MKGKLFIETVKSYRISDSEILIREKLMIFIFQGHVFCMTCKAVSLRPTHTDCHINTACES